MTVQVQFNQVPSTCQSSPINVAMSFAGYDILEFLHVRRICVTILLYRSNYTGSQYVRDNVGEMGTNLTDPFHQQEDLTSRANMIL